VELLHSDSCGPMPPSKAGSRYFILFIDDYTRMTYVYFLQRKNAELCSNAFVEFLNYQSSHYPQFPVARFRSDNRRGKYDNELFKRLLRERGISFEPSVPYSPYQNGVAERMIQTITTRARSILLDARLPIDFWAEVVNTAVYLQQWIPSVSLDNSPPYIVLESASQIGHSTTRILSAPRSAYSIDHLRRMGCVAYRRTPDATLDSMKSLKFGARAQIAMMLGYTNSTKIWRLWDFQGKQGQGKPINCSDVQFIESQNAWEKVLGGSEKVDTRKFDANSIGNAFELALGHDPCGIDAPSENSDENRASADAIHLGDSWMQAGGKHSDSVTCVHVPVTVHRSGQCRISYV